MGVAILDHTLRGGAVIGFPPQIARSRTVDSSATRRSTLAADSKNSWREDLGVTCRAHVISALGKKSWRNHELVPTSKKFRISLKLRFVGGRQGPMLMNQ